MHNRRSASHDDDNSVLARLVVRDISVDSQDIPVGLGQSHACPRAPGAPFTNMVKL